MHTCTHHMPTHKSTRKHLHARTHAHTHTHTHTHTKHLHRPTTIRNVYNWRVKETERMVAIVNETRKLGATVEEGRDYCVITPPKQVCVCVCV
jgi:hypothetical protein